MSEFDQTVAAKNGDANAWLNLWNKYRGVMVGTLACVIGYTEEELESEAYELFAHKLQIFEPTKVCVSHDSFTFSFMVINGAKNLRDRLINQSRRLGTLDDNEYVEFLSEDAGVVKMNTFVPEHETNKYAADLIVTRDPKEDMTVRIKRFYNKLNSFQKDVLRLRRAGFKLQEIADELNCSLSRVKDNLYRAKVTASSEFGVAFC